ncbi:MAG: ATP-binding protein [Paludibacteraceae bacterium]|nr:ATP-binding protein [Paludibacteraceae bacterium]
MQLLEKLTASRRKSAQLLKDPATIGLWKTLVDKYADEAHFVLELIQNADDANATWCKFVINDDSVEFIHNGTEHFTITDVDKEGDGNKGHLNALTSIAASNKENTNKIGKFGIGFKSVFAYTDKPHIEDCEISIDLVDYIVPVPSQRNREIDDKTYFLFPLKDKTKSKEIIEKLGTLQTPLLYLNNLTKIEWQTLNNRKGEYTKSIESEDFIFSNHYIKSKKIILNDASYISIYGENAVISIREGKSDFELNNNNIFCFFPTHHSAPLPYTVHAPFLLTDNRDAIKEGEEWNTKMLEELACLQEYAVERLGNKFLSKLPFDYHDFFTNKAKIFEPEKQHIKNPFFRFCSFARKLTEYNSVFICEDGERRCLSEIKIFSNEEIPTLFDDIELGHFAIITEKRFLSYIKEIKGEIISISDIIKSLSETYFTQKTEDWFVNLYSCLAKYKTADVREYLSIACTDGIKKIISNGIISISIDSISERLKSDKEISEYLKEILLIPQSEDIETKIYNITSYFANPQSTETSKRYLGKIAECYAELGFDYQKKQKFIDALKTAAFIPTNDEQLSTPAECIIESKVSADFYEGVDVKTLTKKTIIEYVAPEHREALYTFLSATGCSSDILIKSTEISSNELVKYKNKETHEFPNEPNSRDSYQDKFIVGFQEYISNPTLNKSLSLCNMLAQNLEKFGVQSLDSSLTGKLVHYEYQKRNPIIFPVKKTSAFNSLFYSKWLLSKNNSLVSPKGLESSLDLDEAYDNLPLSFFLFFGIRKEKRETDVLKRLHDAGLTDQQLLEIAERVKQGEQIVFKK